MSDIQPVTLVDSNVLLDVLTGDSVWFEWSKAFLRYRRGGGGKPAPLPHFSIGAHALVAGYRLLTRDARRYRTCCPRLELVALAEK